MILFIAGGAFMLGLCIFVHELGHYLFGLMVGIRAEIFSIGYGKGIWKKKIGETTWQITAIPFGGYVKFYGDDYTDIKKDIPGGFLTAHPLKRIIPVLGGPFFNLILGFLIFLLIHSISGPLSSRVHIWEELEEESPAFRSGMRNGDLVISINKQPVKSFLDIKKHVALSSGKKLLFNIKRNEKYLDIEIQPEVLSSGAARIGLRPPGKRFLEVSYPTGDVLSYRLMSIFSDQTLPRHLRALPYLNDGDVILQINKQEVHSVNELKTIMGQYHGEAVEVTVKRQVIPWLTPLYTTEKVVRVPSSGEFKLSLKNIIDLKYERSVPARSLESSVREFQRGLAIMRFNGEAPGSFEKMYKKFKTPRIVMFEIAKREYKASVHVEKIGLLGFHAQNRFESEYTEKPGSLSSVLAASLGDTWGNIMLYPTFFKKIIIGRLSLIDNAIGPVGMFAVAGRFLKSGILQYLQLVAAISIALMIMNLLPFPMVDGGHIIFFLYEAIAGKPVSTKVMEIMHRIAFAMLLFVGLWIMYRDILYFVIQ